MAVVPGLTIEHLELNESGVLKDLRLRQALQYAINKVAFIHALFPQLKNPTSILEHSVLPVPRGIDDEIARLKLLAVGVQIDELTPEQEEYLHSWGA